MRLAPNKSRVPLGSGIRVTVRSGGTLEGTLVDIDDECLIIDDSASEIILEADAIARIEQSMQGLERFRFTCREILK